MRVYQPYLGLEEHMVVLHKEFIYRYLDTALTPKFKLLYLNRLPSQKKGRQLTSDFIKKDEDLRLKN